MSKDSILIVSALPAEGVPASEAGLKSKLTPQFFGEVATDALSKAIAAFSEQITKTLDEAGTLNGRAYQVDQIEVSAVVTADGNIGILGSTVGGSVQGGIKFIWKRKDRPSSSH